MLDTTSGGEARYFALLRDRGPTARLAIASRLTRAVRDLAKAAILAEEPGATPRRVQALLADRLYGPEVSARLFPREDGR